MGFAGREGGLISVPEERTGAPTRQIGESEEFS